MHACVSGLEMGLQFFFFLFSCLSIGHIRTGFCLGMMQWVVLRDCISFNGWGGYLCSIKCSGDTPLYVAIERHKKYRQTIIFEY